MLSKTYVSLIRHFAILIFNILIAIVSLILSDILPFNFTRIIYETTTRRNYEFCCDNYRIYTLPHLHSAITFLIARLVKVRSANLEWKKSTMIYMAILNILFREPIKNFASRIYTLYWNLLVSSSSWTVTVRIGISGRSGPSVSSTSVNHSSFVNCGGMSFMSLTRIDAVPVPAEKCIEMLQRCLFMECILGDS